MHRVMNRREFAAVEFVLRPHVARKSTFGRDRGMQVQHPATKEAPALILLKSESVTVGGAVAGELQVAHCDKDVLLCGLRLIIVKPNSRAIRLQLKDARAQAISLYDEAALKVGRVVEHPVAVDQVGAARDI